MFPHFWGPLILCLRWSYLRWSLSYVIIKTLFLCPALYLVAQEMRRSPCGCRGRMALHIWHTQSAMKMSKRGHCLCTEYRKYYFILFLLLAPGLTATWTIWISETFLLAASVPNQQKDYILQKDAIISQCRLALFLTGCAHQRANRVVKTYCTD